jgi:hypothetical protein
MKHLQDRNLFSRSVGGELCDGGDEPMASSSELVETVRELARVAG